MTKKTLLIWVILLFFGFASMPDIGLSKESKQTGKTELTKKRKSKKHVKRHSSRRKKGSKNKRSAGKTKYSKKSKYSKHSKYSKKKKYSKRKKSHRRTYAKRYTPPTNNGTVEYRNYKRNSEGENTQENIEKIAPQKEIRKEPKKEGEQ